MGSYFVNNKKKQSQVNLPEKLEIYGVVTEDKNAIVNN